MQLALEFEPKTFGVSELTAYLKRTIKTDPILGGTLLVRGEVSNLKPSSRGHVYFTLKDDTASINAVMWASTASKSKFKLEEGMELIATGDLDLYAPNGSYSLVVKKIEPVGLGGLQLAYEQLKAQFDAEGLFDASRKQALPEFPFRIGIVTASTGAVIHDMMRVIRHKNPFVDVVLYPAKVQGEGASEEIATGIRALEEESLELDAIIVARGGGSFEDLFCFSEEPVVRAIADCRLPVVSAIGHEPDYGLADAVADFSAATPTMAADTLVPDGYKMQELLVDSGQWLGEQVERQLLLSEENTFQLGQRLLDRITPKLTTAEQSLLNFTQRLAHAVEVRLKQAEQQIAGVEDELNAYSPTAILRRGYSVLSHAENGTVVRTLEDLVGSPDLRLQLADGETLLSGYTCLYSVR
jgi:exodeoxyribonuclease VII large subunit